jgi:hypothetical protein
MRRFPLSFAASSVAFITAIAFTSRTIAQEDPGDGGPPAPYTVTLDAPQLAAGGSARAFQFVNFQFNLYMVPVGDPVSDYGANVLANDYENYTYEHAAAGGSGRGGGYKPPRYIRGPGATYSDTYTHITQPPTDLHAYFHFSGADVAGLPLAMDVLNDGAYSLTLTADGDPTHTPIVPGSPLSSALYTLDFETTSLAQSQVTFTIAPLPGDFNDDGVVDTADFSIWRKGLGTIYTQADYDVWHANFGQTRATAAGASLAAGTIPEPAAIVLFSTFAALASALLRCRTDVLRAALH